MIGILRRHSLLPGLAMLAMVAVLNAALQPHFFGRASLESNIATLVPSILICVAQAIVVLNRQLDLSVGPGVSAINCFLAATPPDAVGGPWVLGMLALLLALAFGLVNGVLVAVIGLPALIATFATGAVWFGVALSLMPQPGGEIDPALGDWYSADWLGLPVPLWIAAAAMAAWVVLARHRWCRWIVATGSSPEAARQAGVPVRWVTVGAYLTAWLLVFGSAIAISAQTLSGDARVGDSYTLTSVAAVVIGGVSLAGGRGSPWGALAGAVTLGLVANVIYFAQIPSIWQGFFKG